MKVPRIKHGSTEILYFDHALIITGRDLDMSVFLHSCIFYNISSNQDSKTKESRRRFEVIYSHEPPHYTLTKDHVEQKSFMQLYTCTDDGFKV